MHVESGWVARNTRITEFEAAIRTVCEPIFEKPLKDISFAKVVVNLFQTARRFQMKVQPQLILLQKTLLAVEGLGRQLDPDLDLWATAKPFLEKWLKEQVGPKALLEQIKKNLPFVAEQLPNLPRLIFDVVQLQKEQQLIAREIHQSNQNQQPEPRTFAKGLSLGAMAVFSGFAIWSYLFSGNSEQITVVSVSGAVIASAVAFFQYLRR